MIGRSLSSMGLRVGGAATSFGFQVLLARLLGPASLGVYHTASALSQLVAVVGRRGLDNVLVRHTSVAHDEGRHAEARAVVSTVLGVLARSTSAALLLMMALAWGLGDRWLAHEHSLPTMLVFLLAALPLSLVAIYGEALKSVGMPLLSASVQGLAIPLLNLVALLVLGSLVVSATVATWIYLASALLVTAVAALAWRMTASNWGPDRAPPRGGYDSRSLVREAKPFFIAAAAAMLAGSADILILSLFGSADEVGIYAVASRIAVLFALVSLGVNGVVAPQFARRAAERDVASLRRLARDACLMTAGAGLPVLLVALLAPRWMLGWFGTEFTQGAVVLQLVVLGRYVSLVSAPLGHLFQMAGWARTERNLSVGMAAALIALAIPLTFAYGAWGTAMAACLAWAGLGLARVVAVRRLFQGGFR
jgi:O-antigen/teichoic acid export membrane protein